MSKGKDPDGAEFLRWYRPRTAAYLSPKAITREDEPYRQSLAMQDIEHERLRQLIAAGMRQMFVQSAHGEGLDRWEDVIGYRGFKGSSAQRRNRILLALQQNVVSTADFMRRLVGRYVVPGTPVDVVERNHEYSFDVECEAVPFDLPGMAEAIETYKPAHLGWRWWYRVKAEGARERYGAVSLAALTLAVGVANEQPTLAAAPATVRATGLVADRDLIIVGSESA